MYLEKQAAVPHRAAGYFGRLPRLWEPQLQLPKQEPPEVGGRAREGSGEWEETKRR